MSESGNLYVAVRGLVTCFEKSKAISTLVTTAQWNHPVPFRTRP